MSDLLRRKEPLVALTLVIGLIVLTSYYFKIPVVQNIEKKILVSGSAIAYFTVFLGVVNMSIFYVKRVAKRSQGWISDVYVLVITYSTIAIGLVFSPNSGQYKWITDYLLGPTSLTISALPAFYALSAGYRSLRISNKESLIMMLAAFFIIMYNIPFGEAIWSGFVPIGDWIMNVVQMATFRGAVIAFGVGATLLGLRIIFGKEKGFITEVE